MSLGGAVASLATATPSASPADAAGATTGADGGDLTSLVGEWRIAAGSDSFVGYRVVEQLANIGANAAVGRTTDVSGTLVYDGSAITDVVIEADLASLRSDDSRRDNTLRRRGLETGAFPTATFTLSEPMALDDPPAQDETIAASARGPLTLHGVTRDVEIPIEGRLAGDRVIIVGSIEIAFVDYEITPPTAPLVVSIEDRATLELQLVFEH